MCPIVLYPTVLWPTVLCLNLHRLLYKMIAIDIGITLYL